MLATLERPTGAPRIVAPRCPPARPAQPALGRFPAAPGPVPTSRPRRPVPPGTIDAPDGAEPAGAPGTRSALRMTVRARRLLAALVLACAAGIGMVAVDVLAGMLPAAAPNPYAASVDSGPVSADAPELVPASGATVTVRSGDTLWALAQRFDPAADPREFIAAIMSVNGLTSPTLLPGQVLRLP